MALTNFNTPLVNRKEWQGMTVSPVTTGAGMFMVNDSSGMYDHAMLVTAVNSAYLYTPSQDGYNQLPSPALAGTFGAGACGAVSRWSSTLTATTGGTTTALPTATKLYGKLIGLTVRFLTGTAANIGLEREITQQSTPDTGTQTLFFNVALPGNVTSGDTFIVTSGRYYVLNAYASVAAGVFKSFDMITNTWTSLTTTNLPAAWGTDGRMVQHSDFAAVATGTATGGSTSTLVNSGKTWTTNQWTNFTVRITAGTGIGQTRNIASNTGTTLTTATVFTTAPDATSVYAIEGDADKIYILGNNAVTMYRYSISANTITVMAPTTARGAAPVAGMSADLIMSTGGVGWSTESVNNDYRYIYSFRGGGALLDRFDIAGGTAGAGAWAAITYQGIETFGVGSAYGANGAYIYLRKDATHRFFRYNVTNGQVEGISTLTYADGVALAGNKAFVQKYSEVGVVKATWLYSLRNTGTELFRLLLF